MKCTCPTFFPPLVLAAAFLLGTAPARAQEANHPNFHSKTPALKARPKNTAVAAPALAYSPRWTPKTLRSFYGLQVGMTRADVLRLYLPDGGLSTRTRGRFIYRIPPTFGKGAVMKIDVGFAPASTADRRSVSVRGKGDPEADDTITFISEPYSAPMITD